MIQIVVLRADISEREREREIDISNLNLLCRRQRTGPAAP